MARDMPMVSAIDDATLVDEEREFYVPQHQSSTSDKDAAILNQEVPARQYTRHIEQVVISTPTSSETNKLSLWQAVKQYPRVVLYSLSLTSAILLYGYDLVIVGTVSALPQFQ